MILSPMVAERVAAYEQEHGHKPDKLVLEIVEHSMKVGRMLTEQGQEDAQRGKPPRPAATFPALVEKVFRMGEDSETVQIVAEVWQSNYMDDYRKGGAV